MRCFIALEIPEKIREELFNYASELRKRNLFFGKATEKENIHLTLKFLGEIDEKKLEDVRKRLREVKAGKIKAGINCLGVFNENFVRIIWAGISGCNELQEKIDEALNGLFERERRFMGHITIARVKKVRNKEELITELNKKKFDFEFNVPSFVLFSSELKKRGAEYKEIERFELG